LANSCRIPGVMAKLHLLNMITLTPEGVSLQEQIRLIHSMTKRGRKIFLLHYHSPSLLPGNTPYVKTKEDLKIFLKSITGICDFFFCKLGGLPGSPNDLILMRERMDHMGLQQRSLKCAA